MRNIVNKKLEREIMKKKYVPEDVFEEFIQTYGVGCESFLNYNEELMFKAESLYFGNNILEKITPSQYNFYKN